VIPKTDRERIYWLEARVAELEEEVRAYRKLEQIDVRDRAWMEGLDDLRIKLRRAHSEAGGPTIAGMLKELLAASPRSVSRDHLFCVTRNSRCRPIHEQAETRTIDVQMVKLRKALLSLGLPDVIVTIDGRGWTITPPNVLAIRLALGL
jgi:DNA-binding response OmpR family regulator